ncbi:hypothetical protein [Lentzea sp. NPDC004782]|uniref:hypothetical protein n=1 Tax=Lentzea sp. NPDC004782 TaxID=3154458 RepID=UPI0033BA3481
MTLIFLGGIETVLALGIAHAWSGSDATVAPARSHHAHVVTAAGQPVLDIALTMASTVICVFLVLRMLAANRSRNTVLASVLVIGAAVLAVAQPLSSSHVGLMAILEIVLVLAPLTALDGTWNEEMGEDPHAGVRTPLVLGLASGIATVVVVVLAHTSAGHALLMAPEGTPWWVVPSGWSLGSAFWTTVTRSRLPRGLRLLAVGVVLEAMMTMGLAMLVAAEPLAGAAAVNPVLDQRLAGVLMLLLDAVVLVRLRRIVPRSRTPAISLRI